MRGVGGEGGGGWGWGGVNRRQTTSLRRAFFTFLTNTYCLGFNLMGSAKLFHTEGKLNKGIIFQVA